MKIASLFMAVLFSFNSWFAPASLLHESTADTPGATVVFPASLMAIEDEAFEGTAAETVVLPDGLTAIGERAFADNSALKRITIPKTVQYIAEHAFDGSGKLTILGAADSYAARWAYEHKLAFTPEDIAPQWFRKLVKIQRESAVMFLVFNAICLGALLRQRRKTGIPVKSMRPQDRPELYPINYRFP